MLTPIDPNLLSDVLEIARRAGATDGDAVALASVSNEARVRLGLARTPHLLLHLEQPREERAELVLELRRVHQEQQQLLRHRRCYGSLERVPPSFWGASLFDWFSYFRFVSELGTE